MKLRIRFQKLGKVRFLSHRDIARCVERAVRRAKLPVAYSEGFSPRPRIAFGLALPTGAESTAEYLDIDFGANDVDVDSVGPALSAGLPVGIDVTATGRVPAGADSLQEAVMACRYEIGVFGEPLPKNWFDDAASRLLAAGELVVTRERKGQLVTDDIRPNIAALSAEARPDGTPILAAELLTQPRGVRPTELGLALELPATRLDVRRTHQWIAPHNSSRGARTEPLLLDETSTPCPTDPPITHPPLGAVAGAQTG